MLKAAGCKDYQHRSLMVQLFNGKNMVNVIVMGILVWTTAATPRLENRKPVKVIDCLTARSGRVGVYLTVSCFNYFELLNAWRDREVELHWYNENGVAFHDVVALYPDNPKYCNCKPLIKISPTDYPKMFYRTNIKFPEYVFTRKNLTSKCLGMWGAYFVNGKIVSIYCLRAQPFWMYENRNIIEKVPLRSLMIPGSHDAGSYDTVNKDIFSSFAKNYIANQEETIFNQLAYGIRYLDIRVSLFQNEPEGYWITHGIVRSEQSLLDVMIQVKEFLDATKEIVIFDFHQFPVGFKGPQTYVNLCRFVYTFFKDYMVPKSFGNDITPGIMWKINRRLIVGFNSNFTDNNAFMWLTVNHVWGNKQNIYSLYKYFDQHFQNYTDKSLTSAMQQMTPTAFYIALHPFGSLRDMAHRVNYHLTVWFRDLWWQEATIVSTDFFLDNNIIEIAIRVNKFRAICPMIPYSKRKPKVLKKIQSSLPKEDFEYILNENLFQRLFSWFSRK